MIASASFVDIECSTLLKIVQQDMLHITSEAELISAVFRWANREVERQRLTHDTAGLREALGPVFEHLRFLTLTPVELAEGPARSYVLTDKEKVAIFIEITLNIPLEGEFYLNGLCNIKDARLKSSNKIANFIFSQELYNSSGICIHCSCEEADKNSSNPVGISCFLTIKCDQNVIILGLNVYPGSDMNGVPPCISIKDDEGIHSNTGKIIFGTDKTILKFEHPIFIQANQKYFLMLASEAVGTCVVGITTPLATASSGNLIIDDESVVIVAKSHAGFIQSLIYKEAEGF